MLGKLFKHEMKACSRLLLPLYFILIVLTVLDRIVLGLKLFDGILAVIPGFITLAFILSNIAVVILSTVIVILRFYKNLITDEGYLMFTLPVEPRQLISSKLLTACIWTFGSVAAVFGSFLIVFGTLSQAGKFWYEFHKSWNVFKHDLGDNYTLFLIEMLVGIIISLVFSILQIYVSIAIGQLFNGHKILGSVVAYAAIYVVMQVLSTIILLVSAFISGISFEDIDILTRIIMPGTLFLCGALTVVFYMVTNYLFRNKLNLE